MGPGDQALPSSLWALSTRTRTRRRRSRIFQYISQQEHQRHGTAYQGAGADPIALGHDADLNLDAAISPAELLIALLTQLVRKAHLDETTPAYVARL